MEIIILKADMENAAMVMDTEENDRKIKALVEDDSTYKPVNYNRLLE